MRNVVPAVFTNCKHRNCFFHIKRKAEEKCGRSFARIPNFHLDFSDILRNSLTTDEIETLWPEMIQRYNVGNLGYLKLMWEYREKFVPVYFKQDFFPFIHSTARSEGTNAIYKDNVCSTFSVISFLGESEKIIENIEELERNQDFVTRSTGLGYFARSELELQAGKMYNRKIFYRFQKQIIFSGKLHVDEVEKGKTYSVYKTPMLELQDFRPRRYVVSVNLPAEDFVCIWCKFQKDGIVCAHILRVLFHLNIVVLPEKYYIYRWKPKDKKDIRDKQFNIPIDLTTSNRHLRYTMLSRRVLNIASEGSIANRQYLFVNEICKMVEDRLFKMAKEDEQALDNNSETVQQGPQPDPGPHPDGYGDFIQDPDVSPSTGRPKGNKRQKTFMENFFSKQQITCSHCGCTEHNIATCNKLHLDKSDFEKKTTKKKKQPADKAAGKQTKKPVDKKVQAGRKQAKPKDQGATNSEQNHADPQSKKTL